MGATKCKGCESWSYDVPQTWEDDPEDRSVAISTCSGCGTVAYWTYGPGLMLNIDDEIKPKAPEAA